MASTVAQTAQCAQRRAVQQGAPQMADIVLPSWGTHKATLVFLPGWRESARLWCATLDAFRTHTPNLKVVIPTAPLAHCQTIGRTPVALPSWFAMDRLSPEAVQSCAGIEESHERIQGLISEERRRVGEHGVVLLCGFDQGGAQAMYSALLDEDAAVNAAISLCGFVPCPDALSAAVAARPARADRGLRVCLYTGLQDVFVTPQWADDSVARVKAMGVQVSTYAGSADHHGLNKAMHRKFSATVHEMVHGLSPMEALRVAVERGLDPAHLLPVNYPTMAAPDDHFPSSSSSPAAGLLHGAAGGNAGAPAVVGAAEHGVTQWSDAEWGCYPVPPPSPPGHSFDDLPRLPAGPSIARSSGKERLVPAGMSEEVTEGYPGGKSMSHKARMDAMLERPSDAKGKARCKRLPQFQLGETRPRSAHRHREEIAAASGGAHTLIRRATLSKDAFKGKALEMLTEVGSYLGPEQQRSQRYRHAGEGPSQ
eukprot:TRINITY_DN18204_c0_g1_i1.p1 TRINITY_DN18204_c0_g1~~TRINITY_DN18204_c0_g1_i1.p1  ORF type:complete len:510 (+),score=112.04 TRINITY_DN18204_c0_g1_i1:90-1532(+)